MKITIDLEEEEVKTIAKHLANRKMFIAVGMDTKEPLDFILVKILQAANSTDGGLYLQYVLE